MATLNNFSFKCMCEWQSQGVNQGVHLQCHLMPTGLTSPTPAPLIHDK